MKRTFMFLIVFLMNILTYAHADMGHGGRINWITNYDEAVKISHSASKPMVLFFTGSDWCSWCKKLDQEVLKTSEFADAAADKFVFVLLDFPLNTTLPANLTAQNKKLQKEFDIQGFPTLIILDSQQRKIGSIGYRQGGGKQYAQYLFKMVDDHGVYQNKMQSLDKQQLSGLELKQLYEQALSTGRDSDAHKIALSGIGSDQKQYFLIERYRSLAENGKIHDEEAITIRQQLLSSDPNNAKLICYQVALIDFEATCREMEKDTPEHKVASLVDYIDKFGSKDHDNLWRLQMIVSQVYFENNKLPEALQYAQSSYQTAPSTVQPEIASAIKSLQSQIH